MTHASNEFVGIARPAELVPATRRGIQSPAARRWLVRHGGLVALLAGLTWAFFYPFSANLREGLATWGDPMLQYWTMAWPVHLLRADPWRLPQRLFEANIFWPYPHTLAYTDHLLGETLLVLPAILLSGQVALGLNLAVLLMTFLTALGAYLWLSDLTGNRVAGLAAALPAAFAPYKLANIAHLNTLASGGLVLALWALTRVWRGGGWRWRVLLAGAVILQGLTSIYYFYALLVGLAVTLGYLVLAEWRAVRRRRLAGLALALGAGLLLLVPFFWPYLQVSRELGFTRTLDDARAGSAQWQNYLGVTPNNFFWGRLLQDYSWGNPERWLFPGVVAPILALMGLVASWRRERWLFLGLAGAGFVLTFGPYQDVGSWRIPLPYWLLYAVVPGFSALRVPTRFGVLVLVGLGGLAGLGIEALGHAIARWLAARGTPGGPGRRRRRARRGAGAPGPVVVPRRVALAGLVGGVVALTGLSAVDYATHTGNTGAVAGAIDAPVYRWLAVNGTGPVVELPLPGPNSTTALTNLASTVYWRPNLGGNSGNLPPAYSGLSKTTARFPDQASISLVQSVGTEHIVVHGDQMATGWEEKLARFSGPAGPLRQVARFGADTVFELAPDPWLERLAGAVPADAPVILPTLDRAPTELELLTVYLRRAGHTVYGSGQVSTHQYRLPAGGQLPTYAVLAADLDPLLYGYLPGEAVTSYGGLTLYRASADTRDARLLNDPSLSPSMGGASAVSIPLRRDQRESGAAIVAFVNTAPGEVRLAWGAVSRQETLPAGLIVYRLRAEGAASTLTMTAASGAPIYPRWVRQETTEAASGIVGSAPVLLIDPAVSRQSDNRVTVTTTILPLPLATGDTGQPYIVGLDIFQHPRGVHPSGHYGNWLVPVPAGQVARRVELRFTIDKRALDATTDGAWTSVIAWTGPPDAGQFKASLVVTRDDKVVRTIPAFDFNLLNWRSRFVDLTLPRGGPYILPLPK